MNRRVKKFMLPVLRGRWLVMVLLFAVLALIGIALFAISPTLALACAGMVPMLGVVLPEEDFQKKILEGIEGQNKRLGDLETGITGFKSDRQKVMDDLGRADKEVKAALEDLTKVKKTCNDFDEMLKKMEKVQKSILLNARSSFGSPLQRALANEETRFALNAVVRYTVALKHPEISVDPAYTKFVQEAVGKLKALTGVDSSLGQATVPQQTFNEIYDTLLEFGDYSTLGVMRLGMRTTVLPVATARPQFYWIGAQTGQAESSIITSGAFTGGQVLLIVQTLAVLMYVARELLADSTVDLAPYVLRQMAESVAWGMDTAAFIGTGNVDQTNAGYVGIFNAPLANTNLAAVAAAGNVTVAQTQLDDWVNVLLTVSPIVLKRKPKWWIHPQMLARAALIRDKMGRPIFQTFTEVPMPGSIGSILGYPVVPTAIAPSIDGNAQPIAAFGDPDGQAVGIREDLELATSDDIGFPQNLRAFRTLMRAGVKMKTLAGSTALKPFAVLQNAPA
jgi:HK97 family phage major capsid protein